MDKQEQLLFEKNSFLEKELAGKTRELEIEASLERVREKAIAMRASEELNGLIGTVFTELTKLDLVLTRSVIMIYDASRNGFHWWMANSETPSVPVNFFVKNANLPFFNAYIKGWKERTMKWTFELEGTDKIRVDDFLFTETELSVLPDFVIAGMKEPDRVFFSASFNNFGCLRLTSLEPLPEEHFDILLRFAKVFDLTYTRFNDLKKAEAQARESQIELALERVRAKTMAMQKPSEFVDVINIIGEQFIHLGFDFNWVNFSATGHDTSNAIDIWDFFVIGEYRGAKRITIPIFDHPVFTKAAESVSDYYKTGQEFSVVVLNKKDKDTFLDHLFTTTAFKDFPDEFKIAQYNGEGYLTSNVVLKDSWLSIGKYDTKPFTDEQNAILKRFANAFGQAYTRFLDLQKAEAQAREAQIELGLERVRARAMAMHSSVELKEVVKTLFEELTHLDVNVQACLIATFDAATFDQRSWMIHLKTNEPYALLIPHNEQPFYHEMLKAWKERNVNWAYILEGETKIKWEDFLFADTDFRLLPQAVKKEMQKREKVFFAASYYTYGAIQASSPAPFSKQSIDILQRFSKVFDSCYTRFLDLQKAEAQAREAQIELGLERVRARAMAMQKSDELKELIGTVFTELTKLDLVLTRCVIMIYDTNNLGITWWMANSEDPSNPAGLFVKYHQLPPHLAYIRAWKERDLKWQYILEGKIKKEWDNFLFSETELSLLPDFVIAGMKAPDKVYLNASFNSFGNLTLASLEPLSNEHFDILLRFAKVFDLTYTRFNDLQKAEAQAREAQIETSLERVRSKTMAMHNSADVGETVAALFDELKKLGIETIRCGIGIMQNAKTMEVWTAKPNENNKIDLIIGHLDMNLHPLL
ncbi:MAG TPA: hypothetical protein VLI68_08225, partial [Hanamia sp.]|nr:hypothetical protein [Hanamia sp.]